MRSLLFRQLPFHVRHGLATKIYHVQLGVTSGTDEGPSSRHEDRGFRFGAGNQEVRGGAARRSSFVRRTIFTACVHNSVSEPRLFTDFAVLLLEARTLYNSSAHFSKTS